MAVPDWSTDPNQNGTIDGINIAENCPAANLNNAIRSVMASVRVFYNNVPNGSAYVTKSGGVFTDQPVFQGRGAFTHWNDTGMTSAREFVISNGGATPSGMVNGDKLYELQ